MTKLKRLPGLQSLPAKIVEISRVAESADIAQTADRDYRMGLPGLHILPAKNAEIVGVAESAQNTKIAKTTEIADLVKGVEIADCGLRKLSLPFLPKVPILQTEIAMEIAGSADIAQIAEVAESVA